MTNEKENFATESLFEEIEISEDIKTHIKLNLHLLQHQKLYLRQHQRLQENSAYNKNIKEITYEELIKRHLETLKKVRAKEQDIPKGLTKDWLKIQTEVKKLKSGEDIDYSVWRLLLCNLLTPIKVERDIHL